jgi:hypothetical protein
MIIRGGTYLLFFQARIGKTPLSGFSCDAQVVSYSVARVRHIVSCYGKMETENPNRVGRCSLLARSCGNGVFIQRADGSIGKNALYPDNLALLQKSRRLWKSADARTINPMENDTMITFLLGMPVGAALLWAGAYAWESWQRHRDDRD